MNEVKVYFKAKSDIGNNKQTQGIMIDVPLNIEDKKIKGYNDGTGFKAIESKNETELIQIITETVLNNLPRMAKGKTYAHLVSKDKTIDPDSITLDYKNKTLSYNAQITF